MLFLFILKFHIIPEYQKSDIMCCNCLVIIEFYDSLKSVAVENIAWNQQKFTKKKCYSKNLLQMQ